MSNACDRCRVERQFSEDSIFCIKCIHGKRKIESLKKAREEAIKAQISYRGEQE